MSRSWWRWSWRIPLLLAAFPLLYLLSAVLLGLIPVNAGHVQPQRGVDIHVITNGAHAGLVVPLRSHRMDWTTLFPQGRRSSTDTAYRYMSVGWGDRGFYLTTPTWDDLTAGVALRAVLWPTPAAMHVVMLHSAPREDRDHVRIRLSGEQYDRLVAHIAAAFQMRNGMPVPIAGAGYGSADTFYEAHGRYHLFKTSNSWTAAGLRECGVRAPLWSPFDRAVMYHARRAR